MLPDESLPVFDYLADFRAIRHEFVPAQPREEFLCRGRAVGVQETGVQFIGIDLAFPDFEYVYRCMMEEVVFMGHGLRQFFKQGEFLPVIDSFGLHAQVTTPCRIIKWVHLAGFFQQQFPLDGTRRAVR